jgi:hypothetical protein
MITRRALYGAFLRQLRTREAQFSTGTPPSSHRVPFDCNPPLPLDFTPQLHAAPPLGSILSSVANSPIDVCTSDHECWRAYSAIQGRERMTVWHAMLLDERKYTCSRLNLGGFSQEPFVGVSNTQIACAPRSNLISYLLVVSCRDEYIPFHMILIVLVPADEKS